MASASFDSYLQSLPAFGFAESVNTRRDEYGRIINDDTRGMGRDSQPTLDLSFVPPPVTDFDFGPPPSAAQNDVDFAGNVEALEDFYKPIVPMPSTPMNRENQRISPQPALAEDHKKPMIPMNGGFTIPPFSPEDDVMISPSDARNLPTFGHIPGGDFPNERTRDDQMWREGRVAWGDKDGSVTYIDNDPLDTTNFGTNRRPAQQQQDEQSQQSQQNKMFSDLPNFTPERQLELSKALIANDAALRGRRMQIMELQQEKQKLSQQHDMLQQSFDAMPDGRRLAELETFLRDFRRDAESGWNITPERARQAQAAADVLQQRAKIGSSLAGIKNQLKTAAQMENMLVNAPVVKPEDVVSGMASEWNRLDESAKRSKRLANIDLMIAEKQEQLESIDMPKPGDDPIAFNNKRKQLEKQIRSLKTERSRAIAGADSAGSGSGSGGGGTGTGTGTGGGTGDADDANKRKMRDDIRARILRQRPNAKEEEIQAYLRSKGL
jgi:hypothetical protein